MDRLGKLLRAPGLDIFDVAALAGIVLLWTGLDEVIGAAWARVAVAALLLAFGVLPSLAAIRRKP